VADENMVKTILRNLISNAIKFTSDKGIISVSAMLSPNQVEICVSDSGVGIPQEKIPLLFRIETNTSTKGTSQESGSGLGLILCKEFVERHHGKIWVESIVGVGSQFKFTLPVKFN
jgi:signal transduction histidine kinase